MLDSASRAQASIEALILIAALFAFLLAFIPAINNARELVKYGIATKGAEAAMQEIHDALREIVVLGGGNVISREINLPADALVYYEGPSSELRLSVRVGGRTKNFSRDTIVPVALRGGNLTRGSYLVRMANNGSIVSIEFDRTSS
jgi:hypothetical protein